MIGRPVSGEDEGVVARLAGLGFASLFAGPVRVSSPGWTWVWRAGGDHAVEPFEGRVEARWRELARSLAEAGEGAWLARSDGTSGGDAAALVIAGPSRGPVFVEGVPSDDPRWHRVGDEVSGFRVVRLAEGSRDAEMAGLVLDLWGLVRRLADAEAFRTIDPETGLMNRAAIIGMIEQAIARARRDGNPFTVARLDVDGLAEVARAEGEEAALAVLRQVGGILFDTVRREDCVARLEDGRFACLFLGGDGQESPAAIDRVRRNIRKSGLLERYPVSVFVGAHTCHQPPVSAIAALTDAEVMLALDRERGGMSGTDRAARR